MPAAVALMILVAWLGPAFVALLDGWCWLVGLSCMSIDWWASSRLGGVVVWTALGSPVAALLLCLPDE